MKKHWLPFCVFLFLLSTAFAQISPPGLDDTNTSFWSAIGINEKFSDRWMVSVYGGASRHGNPDNYSLIQKPGMLVLSEETMFQINPKWAIALGISYRKQNRYEEESPYSPADLEVRNEERFYFRFYLREKLGKLKLTFSFRPELRFYFGDHGHTWSPVDEEVRFRLKGQAAVPLNEANTNQFIVANEIFTATDYEKSNITDRWTSYAFTEDRIATYFRHSFKRLVSADIGVMQQIKADGDYIVHVAFDLILKLPPNQQE